MTKRLLRFAARGYTIVEISIVLVVAGLLLSGAIASFDRWSRYEQTRSTRDSIDLVKKAIVQYAARNRTAPREITVRSEFSRVTVLAGVRETVQVTVQTSWNMPPSRPYLPCPDIDGDGIEDRVENADLLDLTVHIRGDGGRPNPNLANGNLFYGHGLCSSQRGFLPWRTLRVPVADAWGGLFSYYVDAVFSHSLVGFNQDDHADQLDTRLPLDVFGDNPSEISKANQVCYSVDADPVAVDEPPPQEVYQCPQYRERVEAIATGGDDDADQLPALVCDFGPCSPDRKNDAALSSSGGAGAVATEDLYRFSEGEGGIRILRLLEEDEDMIYEAPAFVVISHGANGYGAVAIANTQIGIGGRYGNVAGRYSLLCASFPDGDTATPAYLAERQNAWRSQALGDEDFGVSSCPQVNVEDENNRVYRGNYTARADPDAADFDDVVGWMEVDVLKARLSEIGALPAPGLPPFGIQ